MNTKQILAQTSVEDKAAITEELCKTLQLTRQFHDIETMTYENTPYGEFVTVRFFGGGSREINVSIDSGWALIRDVIRHIDG